MRRSTSTVRRACALGTTAALIALTTGLGIATATAAHAEGAETPAPTQSASADPSQTTAPTDPAPTDEQADPAPDGTEPADTTTPPTDDESPSTDDTAPAGSTAPTTTTPTTAKPSATSTDAPVTPLAADPTVTVSGDTKVGSQLTADTTGFDEDGSFRYVWTEYDAGPTPTTIAKTKTFTVDQAEAGKQLVVTVTGDLPGGGTETVTSDPSAVITQDPVFIGADGKPVAEGTDIDDPLYLDTTAGDAFSYTFRAQGSPAPTYELDWFYGDEEDSADSIVESKSQADSIAVGSEFEEDDDYTVEDQLPEGITFDPTTGELSGTATLASWYDFAVTATSGNVSTTQYVELTVDHAAAFGITAFTIDEKSITARDKRIWLIQPDGSIYTVDLSTDEDGFPEELTLTPTGRPTVAQGGTLVVSGSPVDRFGNDATDFDDEGNPTFVPTVTSDVATDVVAPYEENGAEGQGVFGVTFPHASIHTLTVASGALQPLSFAVDVRPTTPTVAVVTPTTAKGQLAYTGSDATGALPWALALVLAGAGLIGVRTLRRRHAQR
ncbi:putative Ig domain-containing protein [Curtobacterium sp. A7_M15]|uniref:putative Ig domain-containing protein n=1 Tax=Curtobacterium sp. A7_M15 TaxID=3065241 RepID=UPI002737B70D|nr:putative Ig domain-containing protein [Curtobacterium sp. A7_M15]MDP4335275.1 putative Ig domain-containing protein [Curtobacterium sp. A7_M15]